MGLKEIFEKGLDKTDSIPGSNLGRRVRQLDSAPERIKEWAKAELEKEKQKIRQPQSPQSEVIVFSSDEIADASLNDFPNLYLKFKEDDSHKNPNQE